jgi:homoserine kinase
MSSEHQRIASPNHKYEFQVRVPGSIAGLGQGFDELAIAVQLYVSLRARRVPGHGELRFFRGCEQSPLQEFVQRGYRALAGDDGQALPSLEVELKSQISSPDELGGSTAAIVAGVQLYAAVSGTVARQAILDAACALDCRPQNVAASLLGGLAVRRRLSDGSIDASRWPWPEALGFAVVTPKLPPELWRSGAASSEQRSSPDAAFGQGVPLLLQSLEKDDLSLLRKALKSLQPPSREHLPGFAEASRLSHRDLLGVCVSGSGPSVVGIADRNLWEVGNLLGSVYRREGIEYELRLLQAHQESGESHAWPRPHLLCCS